MAKKKIDTLNTKQMKAEGYGFALAFLNSNHELKGLFQQAVKNVWTTEEFTAKLRGTKWFRMHSAAVRNSIMQMTSDPATYKANVAQMQATARDQWGHLFGVGTQPPGSLKAWAETATRLGWNQAQLVDHMAASVNYTNMIQKANFGGTGAETLAQLDQLQQDMGVNMGTHWKAAQVKNVLDGNTTIGGVSNQVREIAKQQYAAFAPQLDAGKTMGELASPYMQKMSDLLELDPGSVSIHNNLIQKALTSKAADGKPAAMNMSDFANAVRTDSRWQYTDNAKQQVADVTSNLLNSFGLMA